MTSSFGYFLVAFKYLFRLSNVQRSEFIRYKNQFCGAKMYHLIYEQIHEYDFKKVPQRTHFNGKQNTKEMFSK